MRAHPQCWDPDRRLYRHRCQEPSGYTCRDCNQPAGTWWTPFWCLSCDVARQDRISEQLNALGEALRG